MTQLENYAITGHDGSQSLLHRFGAGGPIYVRKPSLLQVLQASQRSQAVNLFPEASRFQETEIPVQLEKDLAVNLASLLPVTRDAHRQAQYRAPS